MALQMTPFQKNAVDAILARVQLYLDARYLQVRRINAKAEAVWDDLAWLAMSNLRTTLSLDKGWGPDRFHIGETLVGDEVKRIRDCFSVKAQQSLLGEIVEGKKSEGEHKTTSAMEVTDMRSLFSAMDPSLASITGLIQTYIWWDLEDAVDCARFDMKVNIIRNFEARGVPPETVELYGKQQNRKMTAEDVIMHECRMLKRVMENFRTKREADRGYQLIIKREQAATEDPNLILDALTQQISMHRGLRAGNLTLDDSMIDNFARAMGIEPILVTAERAEAFLNQTITANKARLKGAFAGAGSGAPYNFKGRQMEEMDRVYTATIGNRIVEDIQAPPPPAK